MTHNDFRNICRTTFERRPASRCVINVRERVARGGSEREFCRSSDLLKRERRRGRGSAGGVRKSIFTFLDRHRFIRHVGGRRRIERVSGGSSHLVPSCGLLPFEAMLRCEGPLNPPETRTLRPVPAKDPRSLGPLNIDTETKTPRRPYVPCPSPPDEGNRQMNSIALFISDYTRVYSFTRSASIKFKLDDRVFNLRITLNSFNAALSVG